MRSTMITESVKHDAMFNEFSRRRLVLAFEERVLTMFLNSHVKTFKHVT